MNCFQHIPESRGAIAQPPRGGATKKKADPTTQHALIGFKHPHLPQPSALHNRTCPCPLTSDRTRNARAPTSPRSIGFCAIWDCISSSSSSRKYMNGRLRPPAAASGGCCGRRSPRCRSPRCRSPRCLLAAARGVERPLLCLVADAPHDDRKRPRRNAHFIGASSAHASNYRGSARGSAHLDDDATREAAAFEVRLGHSHLTIVEASKRTFARILPSLVSCEAVSRQRR